MIVCMDGCVAVWMDVMHAWLCGWMDVCMIVRVDGCMRGRVYGWMHA
jgi:hypothetical protein